MSRKITVTIVIMGLVGSLLIYVPKINAYSVVQDFITEVATSITGGGVTSLAVKEYSLDPLARLVARTLLNAAISGIIDKIQTGGRDGGVAFVQNWRNFQTDAQYRGENVFRSMLASATLCDYTSESIKNLFAANTKIPSLGQNLRTGNFDSFALRSNCTMPANFNLANYRENFSENGGWAAWSRMLEPQNNYYGLLFGSLDEASKQRALEQSGDMGEALSGNGYTSIRGGDGGGCAGRGPDAKCVFMGQIFTPGDLLGRSAASTIDSDLGWLTSSDEIGEVIVALGTALTNRLANLALSKPSDDYKNAPKADTSNSDGYLACINTCPAADNITCQTNCAKAWGYNTPQASSTPPLPSSPPGGGHCADPGGTTANYDGVLGDAENTVISSNPELADSLNNIPNSETFIGLVVSQLKTMGFQASGNVLSGNGVPHTENLIAVWLSGDSVVERYEAVNHAGDGDMSIRNASQVEYSGDIPTDCAN